MGQIHACITNLMEIVSCKEGFLLDTFPNYHLPVSPQTSISPDSRSQSLPAIIPSFCRGAFIYSVIITLDQIIPARHLHSFISDWLVIYMRHWICCWRPNSLFFCQTFVNHSKKIISLWQKKMPPKLQVFNFLFTSPSYNFLNNSPPHHLLNFLRLFLTTSGNVYSDFPPKTQPWITEGQDTMGLEGTAHIRQLDFIHDFRIQQPFSICQELKPSYTAFELQISSLCSIYFCLLSSESSRSVYPYEHEKQHGTAPCCTWAGFIHAGPCAAPCFMQTEAATPFHLHQWSSYSTEVRMQEPQIPTSVCMTSSSNPSRHSTPEHWLPSWANPWAVSASLSSATSHISATSCF